MRRRVRLACLSALLLVAASALADTAYVTDSVTVALYPGADLKGEPLERLRSGSLVDVIKNSNGVAQVRTDGGNTGWMRADFLTTAQPAVVRLELAEQELQEANVALDAADERIARLEKERAALKQEAAAAKDLGWMKAELEKARRRAATLEQQLDAQQAEVNETGQQAETLEQQLAQLQADKQDLEQRLGAALLIEAESDDRPEATSVAAAAPSFPWSVVTLVLGLGLGFGAGYYWLDRRLRQRFGGVRVY